MGKLLLGYPNRVPESTISGGSWEASLPLSNLKDRRTRKLARSTGANTASTTFDVDLLTDRSIQVFALRRHNLSITSEIRLIASNDAGFSGIIYDSGFNKVYGTAFSPNELEWTSSNFWLGTISEEDRERFISLYLLVLPQKYKARYWRVEISDTSNPDGYVDIGSVFLSSSFTPIINYSYGASIQNSNRTIVSESVSGVEFFDKRDQKRIARFSLDNMSINEGYQSVFDLTQELGVSGEILVSLDPEDTKNLLRNSVIGRLLNTNPLTLPRFDKTSMPIEIQETA